MQEKMDKLQNKYDIQQRELERIKGKRSQDFRDMKHKYDEQEQIMNNERIARGKLQDQLQEIARDKYDIQEIAQGQLQDRYGSKHDAYMDIKHEYDEQEEIMNT